MIPIWKGDMTNVWNVVQVRQIYENTLRWSLDHLRPRISEAMTLIRNNANSPDQDIDSDECQNSSSEYESKGSGIVKTTVWKEIAKEKPDTLSKTAPKSVRSGRTATPTGRPRTKLTTPRSRSTKGTKASSNNTTPVISPSPEELIGPISKLSFSNCTADTSN